MRRRRTDGRPDSSETRIELDHKTVRPTHLPECVPWNVKFSQELAAGSPFAAREFIRGKDAVTLARQLLAMSQEEFSAVLKNSPMKRAKLRGLQRNAAVVLENVDNSDDAAVLTHALDEAEPLAQEDAACALAPLDARLAPREH